MREGFLYIIWFIVWSMVLLISVFGLFFMHKSNLSSVAVKPPTSGGGYKATPQSCLHTDGI